MKVVFLFALVAVAAAMPAPEADPTAEAEPEPQFLLSHPLTYSYPLVKPLEVKTNTVPLVYSYSHSFPLAAHGLPLAAHGLPLTYSYGTYPFGGHYPYSYPLVVRTPEAATEEPAVEEA